MCHPFDGSEQQQQEFPTHTVFHWSTLYRNDWWRCGQSVLGGVDPGIAQTRRVCAMGAVVSSCFAYFRSFVPVEIRERHQREVTLGTGKQKYANISAVNRHRIIAYLSHFQSELRVILSCRLRTFPRFPFHQEELHLRRLQLKHTAHLRPRQDRRLQGHRLGAFRRPGCSGNRNPCCRRENNYSHRWAKIFGLANLFFSGCPAVIMTVCVKFISFGLCDY